MTDLSINNINSANNYETTTVQSSGSTSHTSSENILFVKKQEPWEKLGITKEQYTNLCLNNPEFATMSVDKQVKFINPQTADANTREGTVSYSSAAIQTPQTTETDYEPASAQTAAYTAETSESAVQTPTVASEAAEIDGTYEASVATTAEYVESANAAATEENVGNTIAATEAVGDSDIKETSQSKELLSDAQIAERKNFKEGSVDEKFNIIVNDYAKNEFMYGKDSARTEDEWNALSDDERAKYVKNAKEKVNTDIKNLKIDNVSDINSLKEYVLNMQTGEKIADIAMDRIYSTVQLANSNGKSLKSYFKVDSKVKEINTYEYIDNIYKTMDAKTADEVLTDYEKAFYAKNKTLIEAANYHCKETTGNDACSITDLREVQEYIENNNTNKIAILKPYYQSKVDEYKNMSDEELNALSDADKAAYKRMSRQLESIKKLESTEVGQQYMNSTIEKPKNPTMLDKISESEHSKYLQTEDKVGLIDVSLKKNTNNQSEYAKELSNCIQSAFADGDVDLACELYKLGLRNCGDSFESLMSQKAANVVAASRQEDLSSEQAAILANSSKAYIESKNEDDRNFGEALGVSVTNNATNEQIVSVTGALASVKNERVSDGVVSMRNRASVDVQDKADEEIHLGSGKNNKYLRKQAILSADKLYAENQLKSIERAVSDCDVDLLDAASGMPSKLEDSVGAGKIVFAANNMINDEDTRIRLNNRLSDNIVDFKSADAQSEMHKVIMTSQDEAVLTHAASNIYKYQEAAQASAIDSTKAAGNTKAIDAAMANYDKYADSIKSDTKYQALQQETEARQAQEVARQIADFQVEYKKLTGMDSNIDTEISDEEQKLAVTTFLNASPQEQFKMLSKVPMSWQGTVFSKIATYCPRMLTGLVKQGYGKYILNTPGLSTDVIYKVVNIMIEGNSSDKKDAVKYVSSHSSMFGNSTLEKCNEIIASNNTSEQNKKYISTPFNDEVKNTLKPKMSAIYPDLEELEVYNA